MLNNLKKREIFDTVQRLFGCIKYIKLVKESLHNAEKQRT